MEHAPEPLRPPRRHIPGGLLALPVALLAGLTAAAAAVHVANASSRVAVAPPVPAPAPLPKAREPSLASLLAAASYDPAQDRYLARLSGGETVPLTLVPSFQRALDKLLSDYHPAHAEIVALDPRSGAILAWARETSDDPAAAGLSGDAFPAASIFKLVTASALLDRGISADEQVCFHGGEHRLHPRQLVDDGPRDRRCLSLAQAVAKSANAAIAKLALRDLDPVRLRDWAGRLLFNRPLPVLFAAPGDTADGSAAEVPEDPFDFAATAAGFGNVTLTPLHGAALAAAIGQGGTLAPPRLIAGDSGAPERLLPLGIARELTAMMAETVHAGTARRAFRSRAARALAAAGKTGSIDTHGPFRDFTWFVGFAPALDPRIAVAAVVVNGTRWRIRAPQVASAALIDYLHPAPPGRRVARRGGVRHRRRHRG